MLSQNRNDSIENVRSPDNILEEYHIAIHHIEVYFTIDSAIPTEILVGGVINHGAPPIVDSNLKSADQRFVLFGETEIVIEAVVSGGRDGIGEIEHQGVTFTERYGVGLGTRTMTTTAIECKGQDNRTVASVLVVEVLRVSTFFCVGTPFQTKESVAVCSI